MGEKYLQPLAGSFFSISSTMSFGKLTILEFDSKPRTMKLSSAPLRGTAPLFSVLFFYDLKKNVLIFRVPCFILVAHVRLIGELAVLGTLFLRVYK